MVKEQVEGGCGEGEKEESRHETAFDAQMNSVEKVIVLSGGGCKGEEGSKDEAAVDTEKNSAFIVEEVVEGGGGGKGEEEESKDKDTDNSNQEEEDGTSSEASSSSGEDESSEAASSSEEDESSEATSSSDDEEQSVKKHGGVHDIETLIEEGELMIGMDDDEEEEALDGPIKSKHEVEILPPVPKIEVQLEPHHKTLPVGAISTIMDERVIVEGSVQHNPLNEGSVLWITETRTPLGIIDELFGPVKNPYYLVRYNSAEEVPAGISAGTAISFVIEFADHVLNMKELHSKGYDESVDHNEDQTDELEFSDDEKEAEYKRSLRLAKQQTGRQLESKKPSGGKKRKQPTGAGFRKDVQPRICDAPTPSHQLQRRFHPSDVAHAADNTARSLGPQNFPTSVPTMMPPISPNPAMSSAAQLANHNGGCFISPSQQFLQQQSNMVWPHGLEPPPYPNMGVNGAALVANIMQNMLSGANQYQQIFGNQNFGGFPFGMRMPPPQYMQRSEMPASPVPFGGPPVNHPFGPASQLHMGQGNFSHRPQSTSNQGLLPGVANSQGCERLPPTRGDGDQPPGQFNSGQFNHGNLSFCDRRSQQQGGRHSPGKGDGWHHK